MPPKLWVCGHIHEGRGHYEVPHPRSGGVIHLVNSAVAYLGKGELDKQPWVVRLGPQGVEQVEVAGAPQPSQGAAARSLWSAPWGWLGLGS